MSKRLVMVNLTNLGKGEGGALHQSALMRRFLELGHQVTMIAPRRGNNDTVEAGISPNVRLSRSVAALGLPTSLDGLLQLWPIVGARMRGADCLYARANLFTVLQVWLARLLGMRVVVEHNSWTSGERRARGGGALMAWLDQCSQVYSARSAHKSRCVTQGIADLLAAHGVARDSLHVIGNGTVVSAWSLPNVQHTDSSMLQLGFIGILSAWQGVSTAIAALAILRRHAPFELTIIGDGPELTRLKSQTHTLGLTECVHFKGYVGYDKARALVSAFDIALAPFTRARNELIGLSPIKLRDYAAAGKPVVAARLPGIVELEPAGWLVTHRVDDAADLAARILALRERGPDGLKDMSLRARAYAEEHFDWNKLAVEVLELC